jgi:hypothetical protein
MENKNIQLCWSARDLTWSRSPYPASMVYKWHLGGVATPQYIMASELWAWSWVGTGRRGARCAQGGGLWSIDTCEQM